MKDNLEIKAKLRPKYERYRNKIKVEVSRLSGRKLGRVSDSMIVEKALQVYYDVLVEKGEMDLPDGIEVNSV